MNLKPLAILAAVVLSQPAAAAPCTDVMVNGYAAVDYMSMVTAYGSGDPANYAAVNPMVCRYLDWGGMRPHLDCRGVSLLKEHPGHALHHVNDGRTLMVSTTLDFQVGRRDVVLFVRNVDASCASCANVEPPMGCAP